MGRIHQFVLQMTGFVASLCVSVSCLALENDRAALVVALRVFGGLTIKEVAEEISVSERTVKNDWVIARVRLKSILENQDD